MPPPPPEIRGKTPFSTRHHPPPSSLMVWVVSGFYVVFGIFGGRGWHVGVFRLVRSEGFERGELVGLKRVGERGQGRDREG